MAMETLFAGAGGESRQRRAPQSAWPGHLTLGNRRRNKRSRIGESAERRGQYGSRVEDQQFAAGKALGRTIAALRAERCRRGTRSSCIRARQYLPERTRAGAVS